MAGLVADRQRSGSLRGAAQEILGVCDALALTQGVRSAGHSRHQPPVASTLRVLPVEGSLAPFSHPGRVVDAVRRCLAGPVAAD